MIYCLIIIFQACQVAAEPGTGVTLAMFGGRRLVVTGGRHITHLQG